MSLVTGCGQKKNNCSQVVRPYPQAPAIRGFAGIREIVASGNLGAPIPPPSLTTPLLPGDLDEADEGGAAASEAGGDQTKQRDCATQEGAAATGGEGSLGP